MVKRSAIFAILSVVVGLSGIVEAIEPTLLPDFVVTDRAGKTVSSEQIVQPGNWLFLYVEPRCVPCESLLNLLKKDNLLTAASRKIIVVVNGGRGDLTAMIKEFPDLSEVSWYADSQGKVLNALTLEGAPVTFGVRDNGIEWSLSGVLADTDKMQSILVSWVIEGAGQ